VNENYENKACKFRLVFICGAWVGKTSIIDRLLYDTLSVNQITTFDFKSIKIQINNNQVKFFVWDTTGQENRESFGKAQTWVKELEDHAESNVCIVFKLAINLI